MKKRNRILFAGLLVTILGTICWLVLCPHEPEYEGRTLSTWLKEYDGCYDGTFTMSLASRWAKADQAVRAMGTKALPLLIDELDSWDGKMKKELERFVDEVASPRFHITTDYERHGRALCGIRALGLEARPAIPVLTKLLDRTTNGDGFMWLTVIGTLGRLERNAAPDKTISIEGFKVPDDQDNPEAASKVGTRK